VSVSVLYVSSNSFFSPAVDLINVLNNELSPSSRDLYFSLNFSTAISITSSLINSISTASINDFFSVLIWFKTNTNDSWILSTSTSSLSFNDSVIRLLIALYKSIFFIS